MVTGTTERILTMTMRAMATAAAVLAVLAVACSSTVEAANIPVGYGRRNRRTFALYRRLSSPWLRQTSLPRTRFRDCAVPQTSRRRPLSRRRPHRPHRLPPDNVVLTDWLLADAVVLYGIIERIIVERITLAGTWEHSRMGSTARCFRSPISPCPSSTTSPVRCTLSSSAASAGPACSRTTR